MLLFILALLYWLKYSATVNGLVDTVHMPRMCMFV